MTELDDYLLLEGLVSRHYGSSATVNRLASPGTPAARRANLHVHAPLSDAAYTAKLLLNITKAVDQASAFLDEVLAGQLEVEIAIERSIASDFPDASPQIPEAAWDLVQRYRSRSPHPEADSGVDVVSAQRGQSIDLALALTAHSLLMSDPVQTALTLHWFLERMPFRLSVVRKTAPTPPQTILENILENLDPASTDNMQLAIDVYADGGLSVKLWRGPGSGDSHSERPEPPPVAS
ncbi:MAG: hypothetical protein JWO77_3452 [Ilumatobacteraceae bacterium]|nr:hypothetical protein [Ilumatobacteraceae bacterium]